MIFINNFCTFCSIYEAVCPVRDNKWKWRIGDEPQPWHSQPRVQPEIRAIALHALTLRTQPTHSHSLFRYPSCCKHVKYAYSEGHSCTRWQLAIWCANRQQINKNNKSDGPKPWSENLHVFYSFLNWIVKISRVTGNIRNALKGCSIIFQNIGPPTHFITSFDQTIIWRIEQILLLLCEFFIIKYNKE